MVTAWEVLRRRRVSGGCNFLKVRIVLLATDGDATAPETRRTPEIGMDSPRKGPGIGTATFPQAQSAAR